MADVAGRDVALAIPRLLEGQRAEDLVDQPAHLVDSPGRPRPYLWRHEVADRQAVLLRAAGEPPVEAWVVDKDNPIELLALEHLAGLAQDAVELRQAPQHR